MLHKSAIMIIVTRLKRKNNKVQVNKKLKNSSHYIFIIDKKIIKKPVSDLVTIV